VDWLKVKALSSGLSSEKKKNWNCLGINQSLEEYIHQTITSYFPWGVGFKKWGMTRRIYFINFFVINLKMVCLTFITKN
jgi:hypothetical protein